MDDHANSIRHNSSSIKVDTRKLSSALHFYSYKYESALICMIEENCIIIHVQLMEGFLTYYVPIYLDA